MCSYHVSMADATQIRISNCGISFAFTLEPDIANYYSFQYSEKSEINFIVQMMKQVSNTGPITLLYHTWISN